MNCPICNRPNVEEHADEVDIGVGVQKHIYGYICDECGEIAVCPICGGLANQHSEYCSAAFSNKEDRQ